jgi:hypothetical protein
MKFDPAWNQSGLYHIPSDSGYHSYFLKRSWGNYLFFPHPQVDQLFPFILASGGIYKVFDATTPYPYYNKLLFDKFGAPTIGLNIDYHPDFLVEKYPDDYFDVDLSIIEKTFMIKIKGHQLTFRDQPFWSELSTPVTFFRL